MGLSETTLHGFRAFSGRNATVVELDQRIIFTDEVVKRFDADVMVFLSRHRSADKVKALTVHPTGNWSDTAEFGGAPKMLSVSAPHMMANALRCLKQENDIGFEVTYEATHHGPVTDVPSFFIEAGGPDEIESSAYRVVARALARSLANTDDSGEVAIGIGSGHYPRKFTALALESKYALSHMMPKYLCENTDMLESAVMRSAPKAEKALIEWKSLKSSQRAAIMKGLDAIGIDHVRI